MSPKLMDLRRVQQGLARLDALVKVHPELREPEAQARLTAWLAQEQRTMTQEKRTGTQRGNAKTRARMQRLRKKRKQAGMKAYELWLDPDTAAVLVQLKHPGESLTHVIRRAILMLKAQDTSGATHASLEWPERGRAH